MAEPLHRHNGGPLNEDDAKKLWNHVRALEVIDEAINDCREDRKVRKEMAKKDGFDQNIVEAIIKRRKIGLGESRTADTLVSEASMVSTTRVATAPERNRRARRC